MGIQSPRTVGRVPIMLSRSQSDVGAKVVSHWPHAPRTCAPLLRWDAPQRRGHGRDCWKSSCASLKRFSRPATWTRRNSESPAAATKPSVATTGPLPPGPNAISSKRRTIGAIPMRFHLRSRGQQERQQKTGVKTGCGCAARHRTVTKVQPKLPSKLSRSNSIRRTT